MSTPKPRVAVVTGAGRGLGRLIARRLASDGASVALLSRGQVALDEAVQGIISTGGSALGIRVDVANAADVSDAIAQVVTVLGPPQILVNNAQSWGDPGCPPIDPVATPLEEIPDREWDHTLRTGLGGTLHCMRAVFPSMRAQGWGRVINLYSPVAHQAMAGLAPYSCTKAAILALTRTAAREWGLHGITANCLSPLVLDDEMRHRFEGIDDAALRDAVEERHWARVAVPRTVDAARDVAAAAAFLASDEASCITGTVMHVDGGFAI